MVSNEDRESAARSQSDALDAIVLGVDWAGLVFPPEGRDSVLGLREAARQALDALVSHGWGPARQIQVDTLLAARDAAREARRLCWADDRDEHTIRHWGATAGWLASRAKKIGAGEEPDWPDAASSARTDLCECGIEVTDGG
jgi:hypothetical protein